MHRKQPVFNRSIRAIVGLCKKYFVQRGFFVALCGLADRLNKRKILFLAKKAARICIKPTNCTFENSSVPNTRSMKRR